MKRRRNHTISGREDPFWVLVGHFVRRVFASEDEQGSGSPGMSVGAVLAILATPGGFASIFLLDKYSTLMQWFRGQRNFNPYRASIADEYFFVVLSMTITGLILVLRWNRLLPDRRDFANLAVLPIPIRNVFLANFTGLLGLALLFGIDVNALSSFLFPVFVTAGEGTFRAFAHLAIAHIAAVFSASLFSFFAVFALIGLLMLLPNRLFRTVSIGARIVLVIVLLSEFLSNLFLQLFAGRLPHLRDAYMRWLPSLWFLGIYERILEIANARMNALAHEAVAALLATIVIALAAYALFYRHHFLRLAESLETVGGARHRFHFTLPDALARQLFRSGFEHGCHTFMWKVLGRSEPHLMFLGGYLGVGLVLAAQTAADAVQTSGDHLPNTDWLALPFLLGFFVVTGMRFAFDIPASLPANWIFRLASGQPGAAPDRIARRFLLFTIVPAELLIAGGLTARQFGWQAAIEHATTLIVLTVLLIDATLLGFRRIPFTCRVQLETRPMVMRILAGLLGAMIGVPVLAQLEHWMMELPPRFAVLGAMALAAWFVLRRYRRDTAITENSVTFEEQGSAAFELLKLA